ncbi:hypothetical protein CIK98_09180 [Prevotella sp. P2-180]|nr:hypothetical protein CIK98_09180 [Prevotella sp. P2-180]
MWRKVNNLIINISIIRKKLHLFMLPRLIGDNLLAMIFLDGVSARIIIILWGTEALRVIEGQ